MAGLLDPMAGMAGPPAPVLPETPEALGLPPSPEAMGLDLMAAAQGGGDIVL
jgi:hypothetical protein